MGRATPYSPVIYSRILFLLREKIVKYIEHRVGF